MNKFPKGLCYLLQLAFLSIIIFTGCKTTPIFRKKPTTTKVYSPEKHQENLVKHQQILVEKPSHLEALRMVAWSYYGLEDYPKAEEAFLNYGRHHPLETEAYKGLAWCYYQMGEFSRSVDQYKKWLSIQPKSKEAWEGLSACYIALGEDATAFEALKWNNGLKEIINKFPKWYYPYFIFGKERALQKSYGEAHYYFRMALQLNPAFLPAKEEIGKILEVGEDHIRLARLYQESGRYQFAIQFYSQTATNFPFWAEPYIGMGESYAMQGLFKDAEASFRKALYLEPHNQRAIKSSWAAVNLKVPSLAMAWKNLEEKKYLDAVASFEKVVNGPKLYNVPEDKRWAVYRGLAWSYYYIGYYNEAKDYFEKVLRLVQNEPNSLRGLALTYYRQKDYIPAETFMEMASKSFKEDPRFAVSFGWIYYQRGKFQKAAEQFDKALRFTPNDPVARKGSAWSYYKAGNPERAKGDFHYLLKLQPDYLLDKDFQWLAARNSAWWEFSNMTGWRYYHLNNTGKAAAAFHSSLNHAPGNMEALQGIAFTNFKEKKYKEAITNLQEVLKSGKGIEPIKEQDPLDNKNQITSSPQSKLGWSYYFSGKFKEAAKEFQAVVKRHSTWIDSLYGLALSQQKAEDFDGAEKTYKAMLAKVPGHMKASSGINGLKKLREIQKKKAEEGKKKKKKKRKRKKRKRAKKKAKK